MKKYVFAVMATLVAFAPLAANAGCDEVVESIQQKIVNNGVPATNFTLTVVENDQVAQTDGKVVGTCENDSKKIIYTRH
ncbi:DUF1161 domain-containing protein [Proteus terrae subsp. cibarius]|uniref:DUF1161 domain-containing protein n=1 Tax=Proteus terrae subsp. cibarius TaxID=626774 RepID=A0ABX6JKZ7_9GAMM|nr:DUF1161 domain-containing protein [Proteus terrae]MBG3092176.1 DUF1161 domain-containing protein [Proteus terrae subsp. cibarius]QGW03129.1 DUF1161 domain-containing protein [Proteus terrae subsp. cibarius]QHD95547.1 DUF1161 domain-containing protein [Proteus terrae subsp. cibarius]QIF89858.1 DUF1161 domain-containing protein [Proteus terrae subsp. cibarius]QIF98036.1 DUF1161 domain-containing protein [Proteus terrae subsp. cibarius]